MLMAAITAGRSYLQTVEVSTKITPLCDPMLFPSSICGHESGMVPFPPKSTIGSGTSRISVIITGSDNLAMLCIRAVELPSLLARCGGQCGAPSWCASRRRGCPSWLLHLCATSTNARIPFASSGDGARAALCACPSTDRLIGRKFRSISPRSACRVSQAMMAWAPVSGALTSLHRLLLCHETSTGVAAAIGVGDGGPWSVLSKESEGAAANLATSPCSLWRGPPSDGACHSNVEYMQQSSLSFSAVTQQYVSYLTEAPGFAVKFITAVLLFMQSIFVLFTCLLTSLSIDVEVRNQLLVFGLTANVSCCRSSDLTLMVVDSFS
jgi:hypothetical protein